MRVIGGKYGGRKLVSFSAEHIRPTSDRVKESIFNILQGYWEDSRVLDLFSGTGSLGIESLSRGAREVISVESNGKSIEIMKKNLSLLKVEAGFLIRKMDVMSYLSAYEGESFDVVLIDPPFTEKLAHKVMTAVSKSQVFGDDTTIIIEWSKFELLEKEYGELVACDQRDFGDKLVTFFKKKKAS